MRYQQKDFTGELKDKIKITELALKEHAVRLLNEYQSFFAQKYRFDAEFNIEGEDPFIPGYSSSFSIGFANEEGELIDLHIIKIWECERFFLGMPTSKMLPGSKIIGELLDETVEEVKEELKQYIEEYSNE
ncbi:hypothetical protein CVD28_12835 [Bacillus sp. M6-12]|uniref:hypothetical protein n=1 Tax=Bacillus sp. M6-12 TaxID=2054166 RepID=UPI000C7807D4|nr:hypothetical protein [Bacillus sp. M6-12]PLS17430.1 hypothetical protein CVD28_12835 [Bacillus sp. M6-12]